MKATFTPPLKLVLFFLLFSTVAMAQSYTNCLVDESSNAVSSTPPTDWYSYEIDPAYLEANFEPVVINIFFWGINRTDMSNTPTVNEQTALRAVQQANIAFNPYKIFFKYTGYDNTTLNSDDYYNGKGIGAIKSWASSQNGFRNKDINIYVPQGFSAGGGQAPTFNGGAKYCGVNVSNFNDEDGQASLIHEIGHILGLRHTESGYGTAFCERVTRDPNDVDNYNADSAGDYVVDTAAMPKFWDGTIDVDANTCQYIGDGRDCGDVLYDIYESDIRNYLNNGAVGAYFDIGCKNTFSTGQGIRMRENIEYHIIYTSGYQEIFNDLESLYEPYKGIYRINGPFNAAIHTTYFQPGFTYSFIDCDGTYQQPANFDESFNFNAGIILSHHNKNTTDFSIINHPNYSAIIINEVDVVRGFSTAQKCYNNFSRSLVGGRVMRFNDNIINANVTITPKDSLGINNENLINTLENGLYKIEKNYDDGSTQEQVIQKNN